MYNAVTSLLITALVVSDAKLHSRLPIGNVVIVLSNYNEILPYALLCTKFSFTGFIPTYLAVTGNFMSSLHFTRKKT